MSASGQKHRNLPCRNRARCQTLAAIGTAARWLFRRLRRGPTTHPLFHLQALYPITPMCTNMAAVLKAGELGSVIQPALVLIHPSVVALGDRSEEQQQLGHAQWRSLPAIPVSTPSAPNQL